MNTIRFLAEWALRSSALILCGALLLKLLRVKDSSVRLAAWTAMLFGSLLIPALSAALGAMPFGEIGTIRPVAAPAVIYEAAAAPVREAHRQIESIAGSFDWALAAAILYTLVAGALVLRLCIGLAMSRRLRSRSRPTGHATQGIEIRESDLVGAPVTLGIARSVIVLPCGWRGWDGAKLEAVLAHERSHVRRNDPAVQLLSAIHRALVWHSPLSWFLHRRIVRLAEEASDDAAVAAAQDRAFYAEVLLDFMQRGVRGAGRLGVAMARYDRPEERIHRILDGTGLSRGVTRWSMAAILGLGLPLAYLAAAATPQRSPQAGTATALSGTPAVPAAPGAGAQATTAATAAKIRRYEIVRGDSISGSWDSRDSSELNRLRGSFGQRFAWFRQGGNEYVVTDAGVLAELERAMEPQTQVNRMQGEVNRLQAQVNEMQSKVNSQQDQVNALQRQANRRQDLVNRIQASGASEDREVLIRKLEAAIQELRTGSGDADQQAVNRSQARVNEEQARVNEEQGKVNQEQRKVNEEQKRVSAAYGRRIEEILNSAAQRGLAQRLI